MDEFRSASAEDWLGVADAFNRYAYGVDLADAETLASAFTDDGAIEWSGTGRIDGGGARISRLIIPSVARYSGSQHAVSNVVARVSGEHAQAVAYAEALSVMEPPPSDAWLRLVGIYEADLTRVNGRWHFAHLVFHCSWWNGRADAIGWPPPPHYEPRWKGYAPGSPFASRTRS